MTLTVGGFTIGAASITPLSYTNFNLTSSQLFVADLLDQSVAALLAGGWAAEGWSSAGIAVSWTASPNAHIYRRLENTSGASLFLGIGGPTNNAEAANPAVTILHTSNNGSTDNSSNRNTPVLLIAYAPPTVGVGTGSGTPLSNTNGTWFTDPDVFRFTVLGGETTPVSSASRTPIEFFWGVKGDTFWLTRRYSTSAASTFAATVVAGQIIIPAESADTGPLSTYGLLKLGANTASLTSTISTNSEAQAYDLSGTRKIFYTTYNAFPISNANSTAPPWFTVPVQLSSAVIGEMRTGSGYKGTLDPAIVSACSTLVTARRRLGTDAQYTHLNGGLVLGYKTGSPAW
jgi:hypothetical protein